MLRKRWFRWLIPGLNIKRWLALYSLGVGLLIIGISLLFNYQWLSYIEDIVLAYSYSLTGYYNYNVLILVGAVLIGIAAVLILVGTSKVIKTIIRAVLPDPSSKVSDIIFQNILINLISLKMTIIILGNPMIIEADSTMKRIKTCFRVDI